VLDARQICGEAQKEGKRAGAPGKDKELLIGEVAAEQGSGRNELIVGEEGGVGGDSGLACSHGSSWISEEEAIGERVSERGVARESAAQDSLGSCVEGGDDLLG